jgi:PucR family transcriptional regulator, purine catabolism regulatory protein
MGKVAKDQAVPSAKSPETPALGLRVREVLGATSLAGARVLAGASGLDRVVQRLNVMEVPDILPWVKPHELLLTTGYPLRHNPGALVDLVTELDVRGLAALAIKLHRYLDELPAEMLAEADRRGFPIIEFPDGVGFDDVLNEVLSDMLNRQAAVLARSEEVHRALVSVVLDGGGLDDLTAELARILGGPVLVTTPEGVVVAAAGDETELARVRGGDCFDATGRFRVEDAGRVAPAPHAVVPIVAGRVDHGRIVAFPRVPMTDADVHGLERAATVAALAITKRLAVAAVEGKYRADFLRDLLTGRVAETATAAVHARTFGWEIDRPVVVVVAELDAAAGDPAAGSPAGSSLRPVPERFAAAWQSFARARDPGAAVVSFNQEVVALLGAAHEQVLAGLDRGELDRGVKEAQSFSLGVSRVAVTPAALPGAYEQARTAVRIGRRLSGPGARASFDRLGVHRLLSLIPDHGELTRFVDDVLGELAGEQAAYGDLRHTLHVLLDANCNVAEAARSLHFHYNTLRYRIDKLERMVGPFTSDPALRLDLAVALRARELRTT